MQGDWSYWNSLALKMADEEEAKKKQAIEDEKALKEALTIDVSKVAKRRQAEQLQPTTNIYGKSQPVFPELQRVLKDYPMLLEKLEERRQLGIEKYGTELMTFNGRNVSQDYSEELLDAIQYLTQHFMQLEATLGGKFTDEQKHDKLLDLIQCMSLPHRLMELTESNRFRYVVNND